MSDDDDVDMSLFLTVEMTNMSVMLIDIKLRLISKRTALRRRICDERLPHGGGWIELKICFEVL